MLSFVRVALIGALLFASTNATAATESPGTAKESAVDGARLKVGALAVAHVRREDSADKEPGTIAPGVALGVGWRVWDSWELEATVRGAYFKEPHWDSLRRTMMLSAGGRARWFTSSSSSSVSPYLDFGLDLLVLMVDEAHGIGPSAHAGGGIELLHDHAHHRLRIGLGIDVPAFAITYPQANVGCEGCEWFSTQRPLYLLPASLAATWTF
jgi:hypothetical protein